MAQKRVSTSELKARTAKVIDQVAKGRESVLIVRRGRPVAKLVPVEEPGRSLVGALKGTVTILGDIVGPLDVEWEAAKE